MKSPFLPVLLIALVSLAALTVPALAQDASVTADLAPLPVSIRYQERYRRVADKVAQICREELPRIQSEIGLAQMAPVEIVVTADARGYDRSLEEGLPEWGIAFAILEEQRILVDVNKATGAFNSLEVVVPHELSHLLLAQRVPHVRMPLWFLEGLAQWQAREWSITDAWALTTSVWNRTAPPLRDMTYAYPSNAERAQAGYRVSYAAFTELFKDGGYGQLPSFLAEVARQRDFETAFEDFWGFRVSDYATYFQQDLERRYRSKLFFLQDGPLFGFASLLFLVVIARYLIRKRRKFRQLED